ncbi:hypothetical protein FCV25MIE_14021, partial [Fagus crenata]
NNVYFHNLVKVTQAENTVRCLLINIGRRMDDPSEIKQLVVEFYQNLLGSTAEITAETGG